VGLLIDTSVLIDFERRERPLDLLRSAEKDPAISSITASELYFGMQRADSVTRREARAQFIDEVLSICPVIVFDLPAAQVHAEVWARLVQTGELIGTHDLLIAATALVNEYAVLTTNVREFSRVPGLEVREPDWT
jgi:predicted nucleic acid-binding protein